MVRKELIERLRKEKEEAFNKRKEEGKERTQITKITEEDIGNYVACFPYVGYPDKLYRFIEENVGKMDTDEIIDDIIIEILEDWKEDWNSGYIKEGCKC